MRFFNWVTFGKKKTDEPTRAKTPLFLFNTYTKEKEEFVPLNPQVVKMYNCGPTVYDYQHIGNLRPYVFADTLRRTLAYNHFPVKQVINITDVGHLTSDSDEGEDKMEAGAKRAGVSAKKLAEKVTTVFKQDLTKLNIGTEKILFAKATDFISEQIALVETLEQKGYTYTTNDGVYFDTARFLEYGKLGNIDTAALKEGARVTPNDEKHTPADFALWKFSPKDTKRQQEWDSPWGKGFPGWHLECTAMIFSELGRQIDIHTGGIDHIPVHHNNEIAQAEVITKKPYVKYWLHNAFITIEGQKISKSLGNTILLRQIEDRGMTPLSYRYWLLTSHYRTPTNFTWEAIGGAETAYLRLLRYFVEELGEKNGKINESYRERFHKHINDDLDTPGALAVLWELVKDTTVETKDKRITLLEFDKVLGLGLIEGHRKLKKADKKLSISELPTTLRELLEEREAAREAKDWAKADELRSAIEAKGYKVADTDNGPEIEKKL